MPVVMCGNDLNNHYSCCWVHIVCKFIFINNSFTSVQTRTDLTKKHQREPVKCMEDIWSPYTPVVEVIRCAFIQVATGLPDSCGTSCLESVYSSLKYSSQCWPAVWYYPISGPYPSQCQLRLSLSVFLLNCSVLFSSYQWFVPSLSC